jgi:hypothetical protein
LLKKPWTAQTVACCCLLVFAGLAAAQVITGSIIGTALDDTGAVIPGANATLTSDALPGGPRTELTNDKGQFRFRNLPPGTYTLEIALQGFNTYRVENLRVTVGGTLEVNANLGMAAVEETVTVTGEVPLVDTRKSGVSTNYTQEYYENIPMRRFSQFDFIKATPGMTGNSPTAADNDLVTAYGTGVDTNAWLMDGTDFTSPWAGGAWPWPDTDVIEEMEVLTLGASAEYGNIQGAVFNVVTKQGTNQFQFDTSYYFQDQALTSQPIKLPCEGCTEPVSGFTRDRYNDFNIHAGGPIVKDRAWIFGGYQYLRDYDTQPGADPVFPEKYEADRIFWKFTWQINDRMKFMHSYHDDYWLDPDTPSVAEPFEGTVNFGGNAPSTTFGLFTHILSDNTFYEVRVGGYYVPDDFYDPNSGSVTIPHRLDGTRGINSCLSPDLDVPCGSPGFGEFKMSRTEVKAKLSHYATDFLGADHDFKFGVQHTRAWHRGVYGYPGGALYYDYKYYDDAVYAYYNYEYYNYYYGYFAAPSAYGGQFDNTGFFAEDVVTIGDRLTLNLGVRFDHTTATLQDLPEVDDLGVETGGTIQGLGDLYTWNPISPRLGFNLKLTGDGRTVLRGNYGRFHRAVITREISQLHPGNSTKFGKYGWRIDDVSHIINVIDPTANLSIDADTKNPYTDQFSIGVDRELVPNLAISATYVHTESKRPIGWIDTTGVYERGTTTLPDGSPIEVFQLVSDVEDRRFLLTNPEGWGSDYDGVTVVLNKRWSDQWQALVSYTGSRAEGLISTSGLAINQRGFDEGSFASVDSFGQDPNDTTNLPGGKLPFDRTHVFRITGAFEIPKIEVLIGANYQYLTGLPWAAFDEVSLNQGKQRIFREPQGARRIASQNLLDFRVSKIFRFGGRGRLEIVADVLNLLDDDAEEKLITQNFFSEGFGLREQFIDPRRLMIGVKFRY